MTLLIEMPAEYDGKLCYESKDEDFNNRNFPVNGKPAEVLAVMYSLCLFTL
jgi:hypothetical protein